MGDEAPVRAEKPDATASAASAPVAGPPVAAPFVGEPTLVGEYQVGHIHRPWLAHIFWFSAYNPYLDQLHAPRRAAMYNGAHARYYAGYRTLHTPDWNAWYVPQSQCYAPGAYGYDAYRLNPNRFSTFGPPASHAAAHQSFYGPGYYGAAFPGGAYPLPATGAQQEETRYTGEPNVFSPYGVGSASYFGAYGY